MADTQSIFPIFSAELAREGSLSLDRRHENPGITGDQPQPISSGRSPASDCGCSSKTSSVIELRPISTSTPRPSVSRYEQMERYVKEAVNDPRKMWGLKRILGSLNLGNLGDSNLGYAGNLWETPACPGPDKTPDGMLFVRGYGHASCLDCSNDPACEVFFAGDQTTGIAKIPYVTHTAGDLDGAPDDTVDHVIIAIHGTFAWILPPDPDIAPYFPLDYKVFGANTTPAHSIYWQMHGALASTPNITANAAVIAPLFQRYDYMPYSDIMPWVVYWKTHSGSEYWSSAGGDCSRFELGDFAPPYQPDAPLGYPLVSSYVYLDILLRKATAKYPSATKFTMVGHSAGGQTVERYAMLDNGMSEDLANGRFGDRSIELTYIVLNGEHCWLTPLRPIWNGYTANPIPSDEGQLVGLSPPVTWKIPDWEMLDEDCKAIYDIWPWGCGTWLTNNPRREQAVEWLKSKYSRLQYDKRQLIAHHYMRQKVYHFQQMGDMKITKDSSCRTAQMGRSTYERFANFKHSFFEANVNPSMTRQQAINWAHDRFIGLSGLLPDQNIYHDQAWMLKRPEVLVAMGLL